MTFKKNKGKIYKTELTAKEQEALDTEVKKQIVKASEEYAHNLDVLVLYVLHTRFGFGKKRLKQFFNAFSEEHKSLIDYYEMGDDDIWLAKQKLLDIGVDVDKWNEEEIKI